MYVCRYICIGSVQGLGGQGLTVKEFRLRVQGFGVWVKYFKLRVPGFRV